MLIKKQFLSGWREFFFLLEAKPSTSELGPILSYHFIALALLFPLLIVHNQPPSVHVPKTFKHPCLSCFNSHSDMG